jgi:LPS-assembly protein
MFSFRKIFSSFFAAVLLCGWAPGVFAQDKAADTPIQVKGDSVEYFHQEQKAVGTGNVRIDYDDVQLSADKITVYTATKDAIAEGHVKLVQKGSTFTGDRGEYNFGTKVGNVSKLTAEIPPSWHGKARQVERVSESHYRFVDSTITTCCGDSPFYKVGAHQIDIYPEDKVVARNALLYIKNVPILFIPYFVVPYADFDRFPVQLVPGKNSEWGAFLLSKWRYQLANSQALTSKGNVLLDYREKRGFGAGVENFYRGDTLGRGAARVYYIDDQDAPEDIDAERYRAQWRHQSKIGEATTLTTEINKLSDEDVIKDFFFREEYEKDAFPDNYVSIITAKPEYTLSILDRERLNDFFTVVERSPEIRFDTHSRQFADTPLYFRQEVQFSNLRKKFKDEDRDLEAVRFDTNHTVYYAARVGEVSVTPRVGTRQTFYSRDIAGEDDGLIRGTFEPGLDISTRFYKTYDFYTNAWGLDYNQIRHIFTPTLSYNYRPNPTVARTTLQQFDAIDAIDKQNFIRFQFENKFQTKHHNGPNTLTSRQIARIIPFFDLDMHTGRLDNIGLDVELRPYSWLGIEADAVYDSRDDKVDAANVDFYIGKKNFQIGLGQRYLREESSQTTAELRWKINDEWALRLYDRFEFEDGESKEFEASVSKTFECVITDFTYNHHHEDGDSFFVTLRLKAFPKASFGLSQTYNRPKAESSKI